MKKWTILVFICLLSLAFVGLAAETVVTWTFPNSTDDNIADGGITANLAKTLTNNTGATAVYNAGGATTSAASNTGWNSGSDTKYWMVEFTTTGYSSLTISSKQKSSNTGPKNFKIQYMVGSGGTWTDLTGATAIVVANDTFVSGVVTTVSLPSECNNQASVSLRWIMTSNTSANNSTVASSGTSRIDDILVDGTASGGSPAITVTSPNGGESWTQNTTQTIAWANANFTDNVKIELYNGSSYSTLAASVANTGSYSWAIGSTAVGTTYKIRVSDAADANPIDESDANFSIIAPAVPAITVTSPNGGETWAQSTTQTITWTNTNFTDNVKIELYNGTSYSTLAASVANTGTYNWAIGSTAVGAAYKIRVSDAADANPIDESDASFSIAAGGTALNPGDITITGFFCDDTDQFAFVTWVELNPYTNIYFTDNAWNGTALTTNEGTLLWTSGETIPAGTVVTVTLSATPVWNYGSSVSSGNLPSFSTSGDNLFAYQNTPTNPSFIYGMLLHTNTWLTSGSVTTNTSYLPAAINVTNASHYGGNYDNGQYMGLRTSNHIDVHKTNLHNDANWTYADDLATVGTMVNTAFVIGEPAASTITVTSPNGGELWDQGSAYNITWTYTNYTGTVDITLTNESRTVYTIAQNVAITAGTYLWDIDGEEVPAGSWKVMVVAHNATSPSDVSNGNFNVVKTVSTVAQLRAQTADNTTVYKLTGTAWLTYQQAYRYQKWLQDSTAGIMIDDNSHIITTEYSLGDGIAGLTGRLYNYTTHGYYEFIPVLDPGTPASTGHVVTPPVITLTQLATGNYESQLVQINNLAFSAPDGNYANGVNYPVVDNDSITGVFRTNFYDVDYIGTAMPTSHFNVVGIVNNRTTSSVNDKCISPRTAADITTIASLNAPVSVVINHNATAAVITWAPVTGATSYKVYRCADADGTYTLIGTASGTTYTDTNTAQKYFYRVTANN